MKKIILCLSLAGTFVVHAQTITWNSPQVISGASDVSTLGLYFGSWAPYDGSANTLPVNGVTFQGSSDLPDLSGTFTSGYNGFSSPGTADANYNSLLQSATFSSNGGGGISSSLSWDGMTVGDTYQVELWVEDSRGSSGARWENFSGGSVGNASYGTDSSSAVGYADPVFGASTAGSPGYYITGTFTADSAGSEEILLTAWDNGSGNSASAQLNLFQVRDITVTPEPSTLGLLAVSGATMMIFILRRRVKHSA